MAKFNSKRHLIVLFCLCTVFAALLCLWLNIRLVPESKMVRIKAEELQSMSAGEFMNKLKANRIAYVLGDSLGDYNAEGWPNKSDIPYLLSELDSTRNCAIFKSITSSYWPRMTEAQTPCREVAAHLLKAVKEGQYFHGEPNPVAAPDNRGRFAIDPLSGAELRELKQWAEAEIK